MGAKKKATSSTLQKCQYFWEEYKYRHDLVWQRVFIFTTAVVVLSTVPYIQKEIAHLLGVAILIAPILATFLAGFVWVVMRNELKLLDKIKKAYREEQNKLLSKKLKHDLCEKSGFTPLVLSYMGILVILSFGNILITWLVWLPKLQGLTACIDIGASQI